MKKVLSILIFACLMASLTVQAGALEYTIDAPGDPDYGKPTSIEPVITADGGAAVNEDRSKNAALIPPAFGSPSAYTLNTGTYLTPNLAPGGMAATGAVINGGTAAVVTPGTPITSSPPSSGNSASSGTVGYTEVTEDLYYNGGYLATLKIPAVGLSVKVYQGTDSKTLAIRIAKILDKKKAQQLRVLKVQDLTVLTDYFVIASGTSTTQVASLADEVQFQLSQEGIEPYHTEGFDSKNWILLDYSGVIVHVFVPGTRTYYDLEHLWADAETVDVSPWLDAGEDAGQ